MTDTSNREMIITRTMNAPRERVWAAFTDPEHLKHWWGPNGFTNTIYEFDLRPGGVWKFMMHGPDGKDWPNQITFKEVVPAEKLVYAHGDDTLGDLFNSVLNLESEGDKTKVTLHVIFPTVEAYTYAKEQVGAIEGGKQNLERWENYVQHSL